MRDSLSGLLLVFALAGCGGSAPIASPGETSPGGTSPGGTGAPGQPTAATGSSPGATQSALSDFGSLPEPWMTEPLTIGEALYDPGQVQAGVVSLVEQMGVAIYGSDGALRHAGVDTGAGRLWLTEGELRGLVEMTEEDLVGAASGDGPLSVQSLYEALAPSLPGYSLEKFAATYAQAYASAPDSFVAQVMGSVDIGPTTPLMRIQAWLLFIDGFVGRPGKGARIGPQFMAMTGGVPVAGGRGQAAPGQRLGTARAQLPPLVVDEDLAPLLTEAEWAELLAHVPTLPGTVDFVGEQSGSAHEGHGGPGDRVTFTARYYPAEFKSPTNGRVLLQGGAAASSALKVTWKSDDPTTLQEHGSLAPALGSSSPIGGGTGITYSLKKEKADGRGVSAEAPGSLFAEASALDLVLAAYQLPGVVEEAARRLISGTRRARNGNFLITWHEENAVSLTLHNEYSVKIEMFAGQLMSLKRFGGDDAVGVLTRRDDGTYRGFMQAETLGWANGTFSTGLVAGECHDSSKGTQRLLVIGRLVPGSGAPAPSSISTGASGNRDLILSFYPASPPVGTFTKCQGIIPLLNADGSLARGKYYLPFNDSRWNSPAAGLRIHIPTTGTLTYVQDDSGLGNTSVWEITATVPDRGL